MKGGYMGRLLWVDLSQWIIREESLDEGICRKYIGGYGLGARIIYNRQKAGLNPFSPENLLGVLTGPCSGTRALGGSRFMLVGKSPLTGTWGDSDCGGHFGPNLKFAGFDGIFFEGISEKPVYLLAQDGRAELRDASDLWGKDTAETDEILKAEFGRRAQIACIGPAGEKLSHISCVIHDCGRAAGRSGLGALWASKRLKAIVAQGNMKVPVADEQRLKRLRKRYQAQLNESDGAVIRRRYGTCAFLANLVRMNDTPVKNWIGDGVVDFPNAEWISGDNVTKYEVKKYSCYQCPVACGGHMEVNSSPHNAQGHKPEYETLASFGAMPLNDNVESIIKLNDYCNRVGLDTISAGSTVAFAMECFDRGLITISDTDGLELRWGDAEVIQAVVEKMATREGFGDVLADGVKMAATKIGKGAEEYAVHCAGQEPGMHDPKYWPGLAVSYQLDATPGRHGQGGHWIEGFPTWWKQRLGVEGLPAGSDRHDYAGKGEVFKRTACMLHFVHSSGLCRFPWYHMDPTSMWEFVSAVTGWDIDAEEAYRTGERIANIRQAFNVREGFNALEHPIHPRMFILSESKEGVATVDVAGLLQDFLSAMEWDPVTARPSAERLIELGLQDVAKDLW